MVHLLEIDVPQSPLLKEALKTLDIDASHVPQDRMRQVMRWDRGRGAVQTPRKPGEPRQP